MVNLTKMRIHIAPVGFEIDRVVLPALDMRADKVWLIQHDKPGADKAGTYAAKITSQLNRNKIAVRSAKADRESIFSILKAVKDVFLEESKNDIYVNVSSGSKVQAIACMMACMIFKEFNVTPYYVVPKSYPSTGEVQQSSGMEGIVELPKYQIQKPKAELVQALRIIMKHGKKITKKEMAKIAEAEKLITINSENHADQARFASLDANIIQPLVEQWKFVEIEKIGRNRWIKITPEGEHAAEFLI
jgi:hypothetical protein